MTPDDRIAAASRYLGIEPEDIPKVRPRIVDVASDEDQAPAPLWLRERTAILTPTDRDAVVKFWRFLRVVGPAPTTEPTSE